MIAARVSDTREQVGWPGVRHLADDPITTAEAWSTFASGPRANGLNLVAECVRRSTVARQRGRGKGRYLINAPPNSVWTVVSDVERL